MREEVKNDLGETAMSQQDLFWPKSGIVKYAH